MELTGIVTKKDIENLKDCLLEVLSHNLKDAKMIKKKRHIRVAKTLKSVVSQGVTGIAYR